MTAYETESSGSK